MKGRGSFQARNFFHEGAMRQNSLLYLLWSIAIQIPTKPVIALVDTPIVNNCYISQSLSQILAYT